MGEISNAFIDSVLNLAHRYLIDSGFIQVSKSYVTELSRARYGRHRNRFVNVPADLDRNSTDNSLINAALVTGLYPKLLMIDPLNGQMRTVANNQPVSFHPSSINFGKKIADFGVNYLCYFTIMLVHSFGVLHSLSSLNTGNPRNFMHGKQVQWITWRCCYYVVTVK